MDQNKLNRTFRIFKTPFDLAKAFAQELVNNINAAAEKQSSFTIALSGGNTPALLYSVLAEKYGSSVDWSIVHFFWGDERCVPPDDPESNFWMVFVKLLSKIDIPLQNIHRIAGENIPEIEAERYSEEILRNTRIFNDLPVFDHIVLGMGNDGHTVSVFPSNKELLFSDKLCDVTSHPVTRKKRVTITGKVINNSDAVTFLVTGHSKARTVERLFKKESDFPASFIMPLHGKLEWLLDKEAGKYIQ
jgi:6-phosphogluconolactonase